MGHDERQPSETSAFLGPDDRPGSQLNRRTRPPRKCVDHRQIRRHGRVEERNLPAEFEPALQYPHGLSDPSLAGERPSHGEMSVGKTVRMIRGLSQTKGLLAVLPGLAELPELREAPCQMAPG